MPSSVLHRSLHRAPFVVTSAQGQYLTLADGRRIFDACGGAAVACIGHNDSRVISAITKQLQTVDYVHTWSYTTSTAEELSSLILRDQTTLTHSLFVSSGSEAMESALKLCRQYYIEIEGKDTPRTQFISRKQSYHGNTLGSLSIGFHKFRRSIFEPLLQKNAHHVSPCYAYRHQMGSEEEYTASLIKELVDTIETVGPEKVAGFIFEPVVGAAMGCVPATKSYIRQVREVCDRYGILMVCDEVMCGMGRCTDGKYLHAWKSMNPGLEESQIAPDIQTIGKGLGGGYIPVAAVLVSKKVADGLSSGTGSFNNGFTYQAHPVSCAGALAVQTIIKEDNLLESSARLGRLLESQLKEKVAHLPNVGDIRGAGLFWAVEFVDDKTTKAPFGKAGAATAVAQAAISRGVQVYISEGVYDGVKGDAVMFAPAYTCTESDIEMMVDVLAEAIKETF